LRWIYLIVPFSSLHSFYLPHFSSYNIPIVVCFIHLFSIDLYMQSP
jgi:hypothetical protein